MAGWLVANGSVRTLRRHCGRKSLASAEFRFLSGVLAVDELIATIQVGTSRLDFLRNIPSIQNWRWPLY
jgi:hypothetical protein